LKKFILPLIQIFFLFGIACNSNNTPDDIIPRDEFVEILTELHIADAILTEKGLYDRKLKDSSESYYNYIMVKHNINRAQFDKSLQYYGQNTDELQKMYDEIISNLKNKYNLYNNSKSIFNLPEIVLNELKNPAKKRAPREKELWTLKKRWSLPEDGKFNIIKLERKIQPSPAIYTLSAEYLVYPDDSTKNLTLLMYIFYKDGTHDTFKDTTFVKDTAWHKHQLKAKTNVKKVPEKIICKLADHRRGTKGKHLKIKNVSLIRNINRQNTKDVIKKKKTKKP